MPMPFLSLAVLGSMAAVMSDAESFLLNHFAVEGGTMSILPSRACTLTLSDVLSLMGVVSAITAVRFGGGVDSAAIVALRAPSAAVWTKCCWTKLWATIMASEYHARTNSRSA